MYQFDNSKFHIYTDSVGKIVTMKGKDFNELCNAQIQPPEKTLYEVGGRYLTSTLGPVEGGTLVIVPLFYFTSLINGLPSEIRSEIKRRVQPRS